MILINERCMRLILRLILAGEASGASRGRCPVRNTWSLNGILSGERWTGGGDSLSKGPKVGRMWELQRAVAGGEEGQGRGD